MSRTEHAIKGYGHCKGVRVLLQLELEDWAVRFSGEASRGESYAKASQELHGSVEGSHSAAASGGEGARFRFVRGVSASTDGLLSLAEGAV